MDVAKEIKKLITRAMSQQDAPSSKKRKRSHSDDQDDMWAVGCMAFPALMDGSLSIENVQVAKPTLRKGWRSLGKACRYPFVCHRCRTRYPKGTPNVWITSERGERQVCECGNCHGGPRLPGM